MIYLVWTGVRLLYSEWQGGLTATVSLLILSSFQIVVGFTIISLAIVSVVFTFFFSCLTVLLQSMKETQFVYSASFDKIHSALIFSLNCSVAAGRGWALLVSQAGDKRG